MQLTPGSTLGPYEILQPIGAGGMGEVYKARDTRLNRLVAIKVSQEQFSERFEREAKAIAALNHPNVCQLYDVGPDHLVMEFVEGEPLRGPLPLDEALRIAGQIAEALQAAHEKGIIHRDLKPANVLVKHDGSVKVLDFGLAKVAPVATSVPLSDNSPTISMAATQAGVVLGTAAYMSPEQARGRNVDSRADIWAFGVVLYEILTGKRLFGGEDLTEILASVVKEQPDLSPAPFEVRRLLESCLQKQPKNRLQAIGDWKLLLDQPQLPVTGIKTKRSWLWPAIAGAVAMVGAVGWFIHLRETLPPEKTFNLSVSLPDDAVPRGVAMSPDGKRLAIEYEKDGKSRLYVRALDSPEFRPLDGSEGARAQFWSPDGRFIGFFADGQLKTISASGGPVTSLCEAKTGRRFAGSWGSQGVILWGSETGLRRVSASGGECSPVKFGSDGVTAEHAEFLPDGNHFLFLGADGNDRNSRGIFVGSLDGMKPRRIVKDFMTELTYAPPAGRKAFGHVLFLRQTTLMAQAFDPEKLEPSGDAFVVAQQVPQLEDAASAAADGTLVYLTGGLDLNLHQLTWFDRSGRPLGTIGQPDNLVGLSLSPGGNSVAVSQQDPGERLRHIRFFDLARNSSRSFVPTGETLSQAVWSPDGMRLIYPSADQNHWNLFMREVGGGDPSPPLLPPSTNVRSPSDWSRDGRFLIYTEVDPKTQGDIWYLPDPGKPGSMPAQFLATPAIDSQAQLSPDGHWLAYTSTQSVEDFEVLIRSFPSGDRTIRVAGRASEPRWSKNGSELFYIARETGRKGHLMSVTVQPAPGAGLRVGSPQSLIEFETSFVGPNINSLIYVPDPDGKRFLIAINAVSEKAEINVITNWQFEGRTR